ncbi:MAG: S53 family peptidase, partial [Firmicutes bacterium]|nr:S53 family peptidase [Bacillota bacterium]
VDGGYTSKNNNSGKGSGRSETTLDVEQTGAIAPGANLMVYEGANTNKGLLDVFTAIATQDKAQVVTCSWGESELDQSYDAAHSFNNILEEAAAQGQSVFIAAGDDGAYADYPLIDTPSVSFPASSPFVTAVGGTTLPENGHIAIPGGSISMSGQQGWSWSYLLPYYKNYGYPSEEEFATKVFPVGTGGGSSIYFLKPDYQKNSPFDPKTTIGRDVPDVSLNADPLTGYSIYDTNKDSSVGTGWLNGWGGTSFATPIWAAFTADMDSGLKTPVGFATPTLYQIDAKKEGSQHPPFSAIQKGNNWLFYCSGDDNEVTGLGTPHIAALFNDLKNLHA